uniref:Cadherin domain-containing protein n=1 Tax=Takifugu rubripes TaxID=31033 RepID=A0A674P6Z2_TAKRU
LDNKFHVDQVSGALTVDNPLDYEDKKGFIFSIEVPEDSPVGHSAIQISSSDDDLDSPLSVGEHSGILTLIKELDFETDRIYHLQMEAKDDAWFTKSSPLNVTVIVLDVNDNPPVFLSSSYTISVPENSEIGTSILDVKADDADSSSNAQMLYSLFSGRMDKFAIDPGSEQADSRILLKVLARNLGIVTGVDVDETSVHISVTEFNRCPSSNFPLWTAG